MLHGSVNNNSPWNTGWPKKIYHKDSELKSVLKVRFYFFACVLESEFWARFIQPLTLYPFRICTALKTKKCMAGHDFHPSFWKRNLRLSFSCKHCHGSLHLVALDSQNVTVFSELTFNQNERRWIMMCYAFHIHERELHIYGRAFHINGQAFQKSCQHVRFCVFRAVYIMNGYNLSG